MKKLLTSRIEAGNKVKKVREAIKEYKTQKQDMYDDTSEILKPSIKVQEEVKKTIDEKQNKLIEKLQENEETVDKKQDEVIKQLKENQVELIKSVDVLSIEQYGGLVIDLPKLQGQLKVIAHKNGQKVYEKQADFDTLDLLTKRFNSKKNYSELARSVFSDLNRLSKIPIHRTSKKYSKLGSGVVYYNNPKDLLSRLELLGGSMSVGNNSSDVREVFVKIVHRLNKLNVIDNKQVNDLIKEYLI